MSDERISAALREATDTRQVVIEAGALGSVGQVFERAFGDRPAVVVADGNTFGVAGRQVLERLRSAGLTLVDPHVFPAEPVLHADYQNVETLREALGRHAAVPVAVGSGVVNDLVKRASYETGRGYMAVATAASMDGYTAFGAAITKQGYKRTMTCPAPRAVVADLDVLAAAPGRLTASGYGDLLGKVTAGADWLVADALEIERIDDRVWSLVQGPLREAIGRPAELRAGERAAVERLIKGLVMSGLAMQAHASSRPASGAEHQFSHLWEMEGLGVDREPPLSHGFKVGVGSIAIAALYQRVLPRDLADLDVPSITGAWPTGAQVERAVRLAHTTAGLDDAAVAESLAKHVDTGTLAARLALLAERWPDLRERLEAQLLTAERLREMLRAAGCPTGPSEIGLSSGALEATYSRSRMIRRRYTILDLAAETGILDTCVAELFAPGGFWDPAASVPAGEDEGGRRVLGSGRLGPGRRGRGRAPGR
jgi:glycerol-1-phosphate dehydrogenase [NAD(P)+]